MHTLFMNSEISNKSDPRRLSLNLTDEIDLRWKDKYIALSNLSIHYTWENIKKAYIRIINLKYQLWHGMKNLNYLMVHILYQIFMVFWIYIKNAQGKHS